MTQPELPRYAPGLYFVHPAKKLLFKAWWVKSHMAVIDSYTRSLSHSSHVDKPLFRDEGLDDGSVPRAVAY
tara:strand:- start:81 stop:293 length:213 start_codon:yes stop_codon:yes gene_type:complete